MCSNCAPLQTVRHYDIPSEVRVSRLSERSGRRRMLGRKIGTVRMTRENLRYLIKFWILVALNVALVGLLIVGAYGLYDCFTGGCDF